MNERRHKVSSRGRPTVRRPKKIKDAAPTTSFENLIPRRMKRIVTNRYETLNYIPKIHDFVAIYSNKYATRNYSGKEMRTRYKRPKPTKRKLERPDSFLTKIQRKRRSKDSKTRIARQELHEVEPWVFW